MQSIAPPLALLALTACQMVDHESCSSCILDDKNNFSYTSNLSIKSVSLRSRSDAMIRWDEITRSIQGEKIDPLMDINEVRLIAFRDLSPDEIEHSLAHDDLVQSDVSAYVTCAPIDASCALSDFGMFGTTIDIQQYFQEGYGTWLLTLDKKSESTATMVFLEALDNSDTSDVYIKDNTSILDVEVQLDLLIPLAVLSATPDITVDWSKLVRDGIGDSLDQSTIDEAWVASFSETPEELAADIFSLEERAQQTWTLDISGYQSVNLQDLRGDSPFSGVDDKGTWLLGLRCNTCTNPAPRFLTLLQGVP